MPDQLPTIRIFISSPSDVRPERLKAEQIVARLNAEFAFHFRVEAVLWEREPLVATYHFQDERNIPRPRDMDVVVVILWSRLGVVLPEDSFRGALSGRIVTGTEWEFEDALAGAREHGAPALLLYHKQASPTAELHDRKAVTERLAQLDLVDDFINRWFYATKEKLQFTTASHNFVTITEFEEKLFGHLRELLERRAGGRIEDREIHWHQPPFRGLLSFDYEQAAVFFGRTRARNELREMLARRDAAGCAFVLVLGASGSGKSSLVKAGLLPDLRLPGMIGRVGLVRWAVLRPSDVSGDPLTALAAAMLSATALPELSSLQYTPEQLGALLREAPGQAALPIRQGLAAAGIAAGLTEIAEARLVVIVDQLEELFTIDDVGQKTREAFVAALDALSKSGLVWVVATMRSDFFDQLEVLPTLASLSAEARFLLLPPGDAEIGQIIRQPAAAAGSRFEVEQNQGIGLDEIIRQAAATERGSLPLLSFLLDQLWRRQTDAGLLTFAAYQELGGLEGAIGRRAEEVFLEQSEASRKELPGVLRALVTVRGGTPTSRPAPLAYFAAGSPRRELVDAFLNASARLLVADIDSSGAPQLRLAHEALLTHWPRARDQVAADARDLGLRARLEEEAERWREAASRREKQDRLATGLRLAEARALLRRWGSALPSYVVDFIAASRRAARWRRLRLAATIVGSLIALPMIAGLIWMIMAWRGVRAVEAEMAFASIPAGCFDMGSPDSEDERYLNEGPVHRTCVKTFELSKFEVTQGQWRRVMVFINPEPSFFKSDEQRPVEQVDFNDAQSFARLMSFFGGHRYRLPSEAEWEYAARANTTTARYWGERAQDGCSYENMADLSLKKRFPDTPTVLGNLIAQCDDGRGESSPVGSYKPNPLGLHDMLGNVAEWVADCYTENYSGARSDGGALSISDCPLRVVRGGSWYYSPRNARAAYRFNLAPNFRYYDVGFRLTRTIPD